MTPRTRLVVYLVAIHALFAGIAAVLLMRDRLWLFVVELVFAISITTGLLIVRRLFDTFRLPEEGARLIRGREFTSRFQPTGQPQVDGLIDVYNQMVDHLRDERTQLQERQYFLSRVLQVSPLGIVTLDFDDRVSYVNPAAERLLDASTAAVTGRRLAEIASPLAASLATVALGESSVVTVQGARRVKCHRGTFMDRGFPRAFLMIEEMTEELRQFEKAAYEKLIRVMSHEVNNTVGASNSLLHSCLTYASALAPGDREDFTGALRVVIERTEQLNQFMGSFADVARLPPPLRRPAAVREVLEGLRRLMTARPEARAIEWHWRLDASEGAGALGENTDARPLMASIDRGQIEQALVNVLKNAMEAAGPGGRIVVTLSHQADRGVLSIDDSGPGIASEARAHLFTPFFSTKENGQGIGLMLVREVLTNHRFAYSLDSAPGGPTRFTITFPKL